MRAKNYRIGQVIYEEMTVYACCSLVPKENVMFEYVEVEYEDGRRKFFYEDEQEFEHFEKNFESKRFTSYHEFWTTSEEAVEKRGSLSLKYYVRHPKECYEKVILADKLNELDTMAQEGQVIRLDNQITRYGHYAVSAE